MKMFDPPHPGEVLYDLLIDGKGRTVAEVAEHLGIAHVVLQEFVDGSRSVTADLALRLSKAFGTTTQFWFAMQSDYDAWQLTHCAEQIDVPPMRRPFT